MEMSSSWTPFKIVSNTVSLLLVAISFEFGLIYNFGFRGRYAEKFGFHDIKGRLAELIVYENLPLLKLWILLGVDYLITNRMKIRSIDTLAILIDWVADQRGINNCRIFILKLVGEGNVKWLKLWFRICRLITLEVL